MTTRRQRDKMKLRSSDNNLQTVTGILGTGHLVQTASLCIMCPTCGDEPGGGDQDDEAEVPVVLPVHPHAGGLQCLQCLYRGCVCVRAAGEAPPHCRGQLLQPPLRLCTHHTLHWARLRAAESAAPPAAARRRRRDWS